MSSLELQLNDYYKSIKKNMMCSNNVKKVFIKDFKNRVDEYVLDNPNTTIEDVVINFGSPKDIVKSFDNDVDYYKRKANKRLIIAVTIGIASIVIIGLLGFAIADMINNFGGTITVTTEEIRGINK